MSSTSLICDLSEGNDLVSGEIMYDDDVYTEDSSSKNASGVERLDLIKHFLQ